MKEIPFELQNRWCYTPCPYEHITNQQKIDAQSYDAYTPSTPKVYSISCQQCEYYRGKAHNNMILCDFEDNAYKEKASNLTNN